MATVVALTEAQRLLAESAVPVAEAIARKLSEGKQATYDDLLGVCHEALTVAAGQFDPERSHNGEAGFANYAGERCKWACYRWFADNQRGVSLDRAVRRGGPTRGDLTPDPRADDPAAVAAAGDVTPVMAVRTPLRMSEVAVRAVDPEAGQWAARLRLACFNAVTEGDMTDIMREVVAKAKKGDLRATKLLLDYLAGGRFAGVNQTVVVAQAVDRTP